MADQDARRDGNKTPSLLAVRSDTGEIIRVVADSTGALLTSGGGGGAGGSTEVSLAALLAEFRNRYDVVSTAKATYTTAGDHTLITPPADQAVRAVWLYAQAQGALGTGVVTVSFTLGSNSYDFELTGSQPFAHGAVWEGVANALLVVNTSSTAGVIVNADYRLFTP